MMRLHQMRLHHIAAASLLAVIASLPAIAPLSAITSLSAIASLATFSSLAGCAAPATGLCRADSECSGGGACVDGRCHALSMSGGDGSSQPPDLALGSGPDFASLPSDAASNDAVSPSCNFNGDGIIQRAEAPFIVGLGALFAVSGAGQAVPVNLHPMNGTWDFSAAAGGDHKFFDELISPGGTWWAPSFPDATFAQRIDANQAVLGIYRATASALELIGVASEVGGGNRTELKYATPIRLIQFPLAKNDAWASESDLSGLASGVFFMAHEKYQFTVDARGNTKVPAGTFDTLRLRIQYTQTYGFLVTTRFIYIHLAECYGAVARVRSRDNEASPDFTQSVEYRRLGSP